MNKKVAHEWFLKSAEQNLIEAQINVGVAYFTGEGVDRDIDKSIYWFSRAKSNGSEEAGQVLALAKESKMRESTEAALLAIDEDRWDDFMKISKDADKDNVDIQTFLGLCYSDGKGCGKDSDKGLFWLEKAASNGSAIAQFALGKLNEEETKLERASYWYGKASENGYEDAASSRIRVDTLRAIFAFFDEKWDEALRLSETGDINNEVIQYFIGLCYEHGHVKEKDMSKAAAAYASAAKGDVAPAQFCYARCLMHGIGVEKNITESVRWLEKSAAKDYPDALYSYGRCFDTGTVVKKDSAKAEEYYRKSARRGYEPAKKEIKKIATKKAKEAFKNSQWESAVKLVGEADQEDSEIAFYLAVCYLNGHAVERELETAANWCAKALAQKYPKSVELMQLIDTERAKKAFAAHDWTRGVSLLETGNNEDAALLYWRGICLANGYCMKQSLEKALEAFKASLDKGHLESTNEIARLNAEILKTPRKYRDALAQFSVNVNALFPQDKVIHVPTGADIDKMIATCPDGGTLLLAAGEYSSVGYDRNKGHAVTRNIRIVGMSPERTIIKGRFWINSDKHSIVCLVENVTIVKAIQSGSFDSVNLISVAGSGICAVNNCRLIGSGVSCYNDSKTILHKVSICKPEITCIHPRRNSQMIILDCDLVNLGDCGINLSKNVKVYADGLTINTSSQFGIQLNTGGALSLRNSKIQKIKKGFFDFSSDKYHGVGIISSDWKNPSPYCILDNVKVEECSEVGIVAEGEIFSYKTEFRNCGKNYSGKLKELDNPPKVDMETFFAKEF